MSIITLDWMMQRAEIAGLRFIKSERLRYSQLLNVHDKLYDSRSGAKVFYRYKPRNIAKLCADNTVVPVVHASALERIAQSTQGYAPGISRRHFQSPLPTRRISPDPRTSPISTRW